MSGFYADIVKRLTPKDVISIATGATCAYLGDERNLREFVVADEVARHLRRAGQTVTTFLIDDSLDPLNFRQLRVGVNKDPALIEKFQGFCGKPIAHIPDPWECCESYAAHFEQELLSRLHYLDCHPTLIRTDKLYARGVYLPYIRQVFEESAAILSFLAENFADYHPEKLFWALCPHCGYIDQTSIESFLHGVVNFHCARCDRKTAVALEQLSGKLNWKIDCAVRWSIFDIDAEAFSKAYMEPQTGTFTIAQALGKRFFGGHTVTPIHYGLIKMENKFSLQLLDSLPRGTLREMLVENPPADIKLTRDLVVTVASRFPVLSDLTYLDFVKQLLPMWLLTPAQLTWQQRELVTHGIAFKKNFLNSDVQLRLPKREYFQDENPAVLRALHLLLTQATILREQHRDESETFPAQMLQHINDTGAQKTAVLKRLRVIVGQEKGLSATKILSLLPLDYLCMLDYMLELYLGQHDSNPEDINFAALPVA